MTPQTITFWLSKEKDGGVICSDKSAIDYFRDQYPEGTLQDCQLKAEFKSKESNDPDQDTEELPFIKENG